MKRPKNMRWTDVVVAGFAALLLIESVTLSIAAVIVLLLR